jgi:hypothetical protein
MDRWLWLGELPDFKLARISSRRLVAADLPGSGRQPCWTVRDRHRRMFEPDEEASRRRPPATPSDHRREDAKTVVRRTVTHVWADPPRFRVQLTMSLSWNRHHASAKNTAE